MSSLGIYLALQISKGNLTYEKVMSKYSKYKEEIDSILISEGKEDLIKTDTEIKTE